MTHKVHKELKRLQSALPTINELPEDVTHGRKHLLWDLEKASEKLQLGTYGVCEECQQKIRQERLVSLPHAKFCLTCQKSFESTL